MLFFVILIHASSCHEYTLNTHVFHTTASWLHVRALPSVDGAALTTVCRKLVIGADLMQHITDHIEEAAQLVT